MLLFRDLLDRRTLVEIVNFTIDFFCNERYLAQIWIWFQLTRVNCTVICSWREPKIYMINNRNLNI